MLKIIRRIIYLILPALITASCAFDKLFLVPYKLDTAYSFSNYEEQIDDTLTLSFDEDRMPLIYSSDKQPAALSYDIQGIFFANSDQDSINAWLIKPKTNYNGTTIYFLHGNAGNLVYHYRLATPFVEVGYQVFMIDYSGFGFSEGKTSRKKVYADANDGLDYIVQGNGIEYDKLLLYGQSLGGHLAAVIGTENQEKIEGVVIEGAFSSHKDIAAEMVPLLGRLFTREMYSAKMSIPNLKKPVLVIHSREDETVSYGNGIRLYEAATEPKSIFTIDKAHIRGPLYYRDSIVARMKNTMEQ